MDNMVACKQQDDTARLRREYLNPSAIEEVLDDQGDPVPDDPAFVARQQDIRSELRSGVEHDLFHLQCRGPRSMFD